MNSRILGALTAALLGASALTAAPTAQAQERYELVLQIKPKPPKKKPKPKPKPKPPPKPSPKPVGAVQPVAAPPPPLNDPPNMQLDFAETGQHDNDPASPLTYGIVVKSAELRDVPVTVRVQLPEGFAYDSGDEGARDLGDQVVWDRTLPANGMFKLTVTSRPDTDDPAMLAKALDSHSSGSACIYLVDAQDPVVCDSAEKGAHRLRPRQGHGR